jgi:hypothetical protein
MDLLSSLNSENHFKKLSSSVKSLYIPILIRSEIKGMFVVNFAFRSKQMNHTNVKSVVGAHSVGTSLEKEIDIVM